MGTNYYWNVNVPCSHCGHIDIADGLHIGKSRAGWNFFLHIYPNLGIYDLCDWEEHWKEPNSRIMNEYGEVLTPEEMLGIITKRGDGITQPRKYPVMLFDHRFVKNGKGTWDCLIGPEDGW